ncbi:glycosyltransferase family 2 protein [Candidatus Nomurabacteria bacterium]|nr:glycosyltransferase family 2 protein [Candidatus Nomurabacteria bacterium]
MYTIIFLAVYVQVFFLVTFFERRKHLNKVHKEDLPILQSFPTVAVIVPAWNEGTTVHGTVKSLLDLDYPKDRLEVLVIDDGSTDNTWEEISKYKDHPQVKIFQKENGGKHTAVNFGIDNTNADFISCLDADSFVAPDALKRIINLFQKKPDVMAVAPSLIIHKPKNIIQHAQRVEYNMSTYNKRMLAYLGAIHVTPGPFSVFRKEVFEKIGKFRKAHNTEDQEIAYRMQEHHMKIDHCHTAYVYTSSPNTVKKLYKQRLRWIYGFIQNTIDYRRLIFKTRYGNFSFFTLPSGIISIIAVCYLSFALLYNLTIFVIKKITEISIKGFNLSFSTNFDWFFINTKTIVFISIILYGLIIFSILVGTKLAKQGRGFHWHIIPYILIYSVIAPVWLLKAVYNTITRQGQPKWR